MQLKKSKTYKEQVEILKKKGLAVGNDGDVVNFINHVNYYRFSGYFLPFISQSDKKFHNKTSFEKLKGPTDHMVLKAAIDRITGEENRYLSLQPEPDMMGRFGNGWKGVWR